MAFAHKVERWNRIMGYHGRHEGVPQLIMQWQWRWCTGGLQGLCMFGADRVLSLAVSLCSKFQEILFISTNERKNNNIAFFGSLLDSK